MMQLADNKLIDLDTVLKKNFRECLQFLEYKKDLENVIRLTQQNKG
jgi:hypothetical protein